MHPSRYVPDLPQVEARSFFAYTPNEVKHRKRTTTAQLEVLEAVFSTETKPCLAKRKELADELGMNMRGVQVWFQNRRAKQKNISRKLTNSPHATYSDDNDSSSPPDQSPDDSRTSSTETEKVENTPSSSPPVPRTSPRQIVMDLNASMEPPADLLSLRRGSLPVNMLPHSEFSIGPDAVLSRRQSIDSMGKLGTHPYAIATRNRNSTLYPRPSLGGVSGRQQHPLRGARSNLCPPSASSTFSPGQHRSLAHRASMPHVHAYSSASRRPSMQSHSPLSPHAVLVGQRRGSEQHLHQHQHQHQHQQQHHFALGMALSERTMSLPAGPLPQEGFSFGTPASPDGSYASSEGVAPGDASHGTSTPDSTSRFFSSTAALPPVDLDALQRWNFPSVPHGPMRRESELSLSLSSVGAGPGDDTDDAASIVPLSRFGSIASVSSGTSGGGFASDCGGGGGFEPAPSGAGVHVDMRRRSSCISDMQIHMASLNMRASIPGPGGKMPYDGHSAAAAAACAAVRRDRSFAPSTAAYGHDGFGMNGSQQQQQHTFSSSDCVNDPSLSFHQERCDRFGLDQLHSSGSSVSPSTISPHGPSSPNDAKGYMLSESNPSSQDSAACLTNSMFMAPHSFHPSGGISPLDESCTAASDMGVNGHGNVSYHFPSAVSGPHPYDGSFAPDAAVGPSAGAGAGMEGRGSFSGPAVGHHHGHGHGHGHHGGHHEAELGYPSEAGLGGHGDSHLHHAHAHGFSSLS
ncbi:hypothetical protein CONPUDRAFT_136090 [Coniophora puteana RWD-64-598 SS2]|uniref:Homeobox domain-containing protein n=1 Tax=Coniophora puteana (strain RWD-64-598) TaxID=741705 RepID=A0A5M3MUL1_CONPW|nr:uncharacterized protein CONPUDRAFT_136090 [Coniophora puteana RWD-64-598 SS2]EIW82862.1 hypothetical protein CONPUDRAFT_136090 [Coniophora puteana RWD-64-598 SS2]